MRAVITSEMPAAAVPTATPVGERFVRFPELRSRHGIPFSRMHIDRLEKQGKFPRRFKLAENTVGWREAEINEWIAAKAAARNRVEQPEAA